MEQRLPLTLLHRYLSLGGSGTRISAIINPKKNNTFLCSNLGKQNGLFKVCDVYFKLPTIQIDFPVCDLPSSLSQGAIRTKMHRLKRMWDTLCRRPYRTMATWWRTDRCCFTADAWWAATHVYIVSMRTGSVNWCTLLVCVFVLQVCTNGVRCALFFLCSSCTLSVCIIHA